MHVLLLFLNYYYFLQFHAWTFLLLFIDLIWNLEGFLEKWYFLCIHVCLRREAPHWKLQVCRGHHTSVKGVIIGTSGRTGNTTTASQRCNKKAVIGGLGLQRAGHRVNLTGYWAHTVWEGTCCGNSEALREWELVHLETEQKRRKGCLGSLICLPCVTKYRRQSSRERSVVFVCFKSAWN